jgi:hypothetical protein
MSNLSQFFALGGNKIKSIQTVVLSQVNFTYANNVAVYTWTGVTASISEVDPSKTIVLPSPASGWFTIQYSGAFTIDGHGAYLSNSTTVVPYGSVIPQGTPNNLIGSNTSGPITMAVQIIEFE